MSVWASVRPAVGAALRNALSCAQIYGARFQDRSEEFIMKTVDNLSSDYRH